MHTSTLPKSQKCCLLYIIIVNNEDANSDDDNNNCIASYYSTAPCIKIFQLLLGEVNDCANWKVSDTAHTLG